MFISVMLNDLVMECEDWTFSSLALLSCFLLSIVPLQLTYLFCQQVSCIAEIVKSQTRKVQQQKPSTADEKQKTYEGGIKENKEYSGQ